MKQTLDCPVCQRTGIEGCKCPNCETDLSVFQLLADLPLAEPPTNNKTTTNNLWLPLTAALLSLVVLGSSFVVYNYYDSKEPPTASTVVTQKEPEKTNQNPNCGPGFFYTVQTGDSLSLIASHFYGNLQAWEQIVSANPSLKNREDALDIGEVLLIPNTKEYSCGNF